MKARNKSKSKRPAPKVPRDIREALRIFPSVVARKRRRYLKRQKFLRDTFGQLVRDLEAQERRDARRKR